MWMKTSWKTEVKTVENHFGQDLFFPLSPYMGIIYYTLILILWTILAISQYAIKRDLASGVFWMQRWGEKKMGT